MHKGHFTFSYRTIQIPVIYTQHSWERKAQNTFGRESDNGHFTFMQNYSETKPYQSVIIIHNIPGKEKNKTLLGERVSLNAKWSFHFHAELLRYKKTHHCVIYMQHS